MLMCAWFIGVSLTVLARSWKTGCGDNSIPDDVSVVLPIIVVVVVVGVAAVCASTAVSGVDTAIKANIPIIIIIGVVFVSVLIVIITVSYYRHTNRIWVYDDVH